MKAKRRILVPTDFSPHAEEAFREAHALARMMDAEVILFHIAKTPAVVLEDGPLLTDPVKGTAANLWDHFHGILPNDPHVRVEHEVIVADQPSARPYP